MSTIIRLTRHPNDPLVLLAHTPPEWSTAMGRFAPARWAAEHRAYLVHRELAHAFANFVRIEGGRVVDESRATPAGPTVSGSRVAGPECANCGQPGSTSSRLKVCPACGQPWVPVIHQSAAIGAARTPCPSCGHKQAGRFPHCGRCGTAMVYPEPRSRPPVVPATRQRLDDPQPLAAVISEHAPRPPHELEEDRACGTCFHPTPASLLDDAGRCPKCAGGSS